MVREKDHLIFETSFNEIEAVCRQNTEFYQKKKLEVKNDFFICENLKIFEKKFDFFFQYKTVM